MSEVVGGVSRRRPASTPVNYEEQAEPYMRKGNRKHDKERWRDIKLENRSIGVHLRPEIACFLHAPYTDAPWFAVVKLGFLCLLPPKF
eukprot:1159579-Pelagomonas_calceolata.AAC.1